VLSEPLRCPQAAARNHLTGYLSGSGSRSESARDHSITCDLAAFKIGIGGSFHISTPLPIAHCPLQLLWSPKKFSTHEKRINSTTLASYACVLPPADTCVGQVAWPHFNQFSTTPQSAWHEYDATIPLRYKVVLIRVLAYNGQRCYCRNARHIP
jgi:hypothetical protein